MIRTTMVALVFAVYSFPAAAQETSLTVSALPQDKALSGIQGKWSGSGTLFGTRCTSKVESKWVLNNKFLKVNVRYSSGGKVVYEQITFFSAWEAGKTYYAQILDSYGLSYFGSAKYAGQILTANYAAKTAKGTVKMKEVYDISGTGGGYTATIYTEKAGKMVKSGTFVYGRSR